MSILKIKKKSLASVIAVAVFIFALAVGTFAVVAASMPREERIASWLEKAEAAQIPLENMIRLQILARLEPMWFPEPVVSTWFSIEGRATHQSIIIHDPAYLLADPALYAMIQAETDWAEIVDFIFENHMLKLFQRGRAIRKVGDFTIFDNIPAFPDIFVPIYEIIDPPLPVITAASANGSFIVWPPHVHSPVIEPRECGLRR